MKFVPQCMAALLLACAGAAAQIPPEVRSFEQAAGSGSILFRGKQADAYERPANGNPYWSSPAFVPGEVVFEGNLYGDILVNIDAVDGKALVRKSDNPIAVALPPSSVSSISTGSERFVGISQGSGALAEGFYQVLGDGAFKVYKHVSKQLQSSTGNVNGDRIGYYDPAYNPELTQHYAIARTYYFMDADGQFSRIRSKGSLLRKFSPEQRKDIRRALSAAGLDTPGVDFDQYCITVLNTASR